MGKGGVCWKQDKLGVVEESDRLQNFRIGVEVLAALWISLEFVDMAIHWEIL